MQCNHYWHTNASICTTTNNFSYGRGTTVRTRMHSSSMRTARSLTDRISWYQAGGCMACMPPWPCMPPGMHTPPPPCTPPSHPTGHACPLLWTEWQTGVKILPYPKLRLLAVTIITTRLNRYFFLLSEPNSAHTYKWKLLAHPERHSTKIFTLIAVYNAPKMTSFHLIRWFRHVLEDI